MCEGDFKHLNFNQGWKSISWRHFMKCRFYILVRTTFLGITSYWVDNFEKGFPKCEKNPLQTDQNIYPSPFESVIHPAYQAWLAIETFSPHTGTTSVQYPCGYVLKRSNFNCLMQVAGDFITICTIHEICDNFVAEFIPSQLSTQRDSCSLELSERENRKNYAKPNYYCIYPLPLTTPINGFHVILVEFVDSSHEYSPDDIIVTGETDDEHLRNLEMVLQRLLDAGLRVHPAKTRFFDAKTEYCGHAVSADGLHKLPAKVDAIRDAPQPTNVSQQLRSFLGLVSYYARFLPNLSTTLHPLNPLLQYHTHWNWTDACTAAFDKVKRHIGSDLVLTHFHPDLPLHVASDASPYGLGAVLSHSMPDGTQRPIAFASRTLNTAEQTYSQIAKEAIGNVWSLKKFHTYVYGRRFTLTTDHQPLTAIFSPAKNVPFMTAARLQRYALLLAGYQYGIVYRKTSDHGNADGLSRLPIYCPATEVDADGDAVDSFHVSQFDPLPVTADQVHRETRRDPTLVAVYQAVQTGDFSSCTYHQSNYHRRFELTSHQECLLWGALVIIPPSLQRNV